MVDDFALQCIIKSRGISDSSHIVYFQEVGVLATTPLLAFVTCANPASFQSASQFKNVGETHVKT